MPPPSFSYVMKTISGKSNSSIKPSPLSSSRFTTSGVLATCLDQEKGTRSGCVAHRNSSCGSTSGSGVGASVHTGTLPVPLQNPASHTVLGGQSQSSSQVQPEALDDSSLQVLSKRSEPRPAQA